MDLIDRHTTAMDRLTARIEALMEPFRGFHELVCSIPGIATLTADAIVAETACKRPRHRRDGVRAEPEHLSRRPLPAHRHPTRPAEASVATQHAVLTAMWHMGTTGTLYEDPGSDYFTRLHPDRVKNRAVHQLEAMGYPSPSTPRPDTVGLGPTRHR